MKNSNNKGRRINEELYKEVLEILRVNPMTIDALADKLNIHKRTAYRYIERAEKNGVVIIKVGISKDAPYQIIP